MGFERTTILKMALGGGLVLIGGPALTYYVMPEPDELFKRYNPELQKRALAEREARIAAHAEFMHKLEKYSKSDKPIWQLAAEDQKRQRAEAAAERKRVRDELERQKQEILEEQRKIAS
ncbi:hypothetical protein BDZ91DRAFT_715424 [Kalaharituber pfeilii]|nr:hypothetical protein BDZ91DRAFT_715424 [Kalaharituber pfeilii]